MQQTIYKSSSKAPHMPRIGVMVPIFYRGDRYVNFIWENFWKQSYPNKKLFVCRNKLEHLGQEEIADDYNWSSREWRKKQKEYPQMLKYWEQENYQGLGHKRNLMLHEILKPEHECDYIATFDEDDVYSSNYLTMMYKHFKENKRIKLVNFRDFLGIQTSGIPVNLENPSNEEDGALLQSLEESRAFLETLPSQKYSETSQQQNKWYIHTSGGVLPSGFGFSFMYEASMIRNKNLNILYGEDSQRRSGEEDVLYKRVKKYFGDNSVIDLPISQSLNMAVHMENGQNISGDKSVFHFPSKHRVVIPRPLSFVSTEFLQFLKAFHPDKAIKNWAATVYEVKCRLPYHQTMTFVANQQRTSMFAELWKVKSNWETLVLNQKSAWFKPPIGKPIPGGQDISIEAHSPEPSWKVLNNTQLPFEDHTQRSLVVVPRSHLEYESRVQKQLETLEKQSITNKSIIIPKGHGVKIWETWTRNSQEVLEYEKRARQLDLRSVCRGTSCMLIWNSATIHQGTSSLKTGTLIEKGAFVPPLLTPSVFPADAVETWRSHLEREGYVVLRNILGEDMDTYLANLLEDINRINPTAKLQSLDRVHDSEHLGLQRRGLCYTLGFPHGKFAWAIRQNSNIRQVWKNLYQTDEVMGSTDVPALTRFELNFRTVDKKTHDEWLHWDQNALLEPVGKQKMYQSMVYLFPNEKSKVGGSTWNRIAMVVCMVPTTYQRSIQAEKTLLALAITGEASNHWPQLGNANYGWNGIRTEQLKEGFSHLTKQQIEKILSQRFISIQQMKTKKWKRLFAELHPDITTKALLQYVKKLNIHNVSSKTTKKELKELLCSSDYQELRNILDLEDLRSIVHPQVKDYVGFIADLKNK